MPGTKVLIVLVSLVGVEADCSTGNGVVLTATWLLPVALLPMAWDAGDIYGPLPPSKGVFVEEVPGGREAKLAGK